MVASIRSLNLGRTDVVAKQLEAAIGMVTLLIVGIVASGVLFGVLNRVSRNLIFIGGIAAGVVLGIVFGLINDSLRLENTSFNAGSFVFIVVMFVLWGLAVAWIYNDLLSRRTVGAAPIMRSDIDLSVPPVSAEQLDRRQFLVRLGGATATLTVIGAGLSVALQPPDADAQAVAARPTPQPPLPTRPPVAATAEAGATDEAVVAADDFELAPGTRPEYTPLQDHYRIDISSRPPSIDEASWTLPITGLVANPLTLTLADLRDNYEQREEIITLSCISNLVGGDLISTIRWTGLRFQDLIDEVQPTPEGKWIKITGADGFDEVVNLAMVANDDRIMLTYFWDGQPLLQKHGFPLRIYIPNRYGMKQPKWITGMEVIAEWEAGYWVRRGWSQEAIVRATSVIDTVASTETYEADGMTYVPIGGIAFAGERGISKVEVKVDEGEWEEAELKTPQSELTWVVWRYDWAYESGAHRFYVRCVDENDVPQIEEVMDNRPDGATGIHEVMRIV